MGLPEHVLASVAARCEARPDRERCGFVLRDAGGGLEVVELENVAPAGEARGRYEMDPAAVLRVLARADRDGADVVAVWHSHLDAPAVLSARDRAEALVGGQPMFPRAEQLVVSVIGGRAVEVRSHALGEPGDVRG